MKADGDKRRGQSKTQQDGRKRRLEAYAIETEAREEKEESETEEEANLGPDAFEAARHSLLGQPRDWSG